jgi:hypothetical protein
MELGWCMGIGVALDGIPLHLFSWFIIPFVFLVCMTLSILLGGTFCACQGDKASLITHKYLNDVRIYFMLSILYLI